jgi:hypothetical protein
VLSPGLVSRKSQDETSTLLERLPMKVSKNSASVKEIDSGLGHWEPAQSLSHGHAYTIKSASRPVNKRRENWLALHITQFGRAT